MRYIKLFKESVDYKNIEIDEDEYYDSSDKRIIFNQSEVRIIKDVFNGYGIKKQVHNGSGVVTSDYLLCYRWAKNGHLNINNKNPDYLVSRLGTLSNPIADIRVYKIDDEWFYLYGSYKLKSRWVENWYKCDSMDGLIVILRDILSKFDTVDDSKLRRSIVSSVSKMCGDKLKKLDEFIKGL